MNREEWAAALDQMRSDLQIPYLRLGQNERAYGIKEGADSRREMLLDLIEALEFVAQVSPEYIGEPQHFKEHIACEALEKMRRQLEMK